MESTLFIVTPDGEQDLNYLCAGCKAFFTHVDKPMCMMADLLCQSRYYVACWH